jgi:hypothetical protein
MIGFVYFDTDVLHLIGKTNANQGLPAELRERMLLSYITFLEAFSQLTLSDNAEILSHIQAIHNWVNPKNAGLLPHPDAAIAEIGFQETQAADGFTARVINLCLDTNSPEELRAAASEVMNALGEMKHRAAQDFTHLVDVYRREPHTGDKFSEGWLNGIARRARVDPNARPLAEIVSALSAYYEFEEERIKLAARDPHYEPDQNDIIDSQQLVYLGYPALHFLTCDGGYCKRVRKSEQAARIHKVSHEELGDVHRVEALLRKVTDFGT